MFSKKVIILFLLALILSVGLFAFNFEQAEAACQDRNVTGWAWSDSIGWVSFSCRNHHAVGVGIDYGVNIDMHGTISGFAWSNTVGWISFNATDLAGCPHGTCSAVLLANNDLSGWGRVLTTGGWLSLAGNITGGGTYGVRLVSPDFRGWAWGDQIVGWLSWNCLDIPGGCVAGRHYAVTTTVSMAPTVTNPTSTVRYCDHFVTPQVATGTTVVLRWLYSHPTRPQQSYEIQVSDFSNFATIRAGQVVPSSAQAHSLDIPLSWNTTYHWRVRVSEGTRWSDWATSTFALTRLHASPLAVFSHSPLRIATNEVVTFTNQRTVGGVTTVSRTFDGSAPLFNWTFEGGTPATATTTTATTTFGSVGTRRATLRVTETGPTGYWCEREETLTINVPLPDWREIVPFGQLRLFLSDIAQRVRTLFAVRY